MSYEAARSVMDHARMEVMEGEGGDAEDQGSSEVGRRRQRRYPQLPPIISDEGYRTYLIVHA